MYLFSIFAEKSLEFDEIEEVKAASATAGKDGTEEEASSRPTRRRRRDGMYIFIACVRSTKEGNVFSLFLVSGTWSFLRGTPGLLYQVLSLGGGLPQLGLQPGWGGVP